MASSASTVLRQELMTVGENDGTWGTKNNTNLGILESAVTGTTAVSTTGGTTTLSNVDYTNDQAKKAILDVTGTLVSNATIVIPNASKTYKVFNRTTGSYTLSIKTSSGSAIEITQSTSCEVYCDGSNVVRFLTPMTTFGTGAPATASGAAASAVSVTPTGNLASTNAQAALAELQGDVDTINSTLIASYQPLDSDLTTLGGLAKAKGNLIAGNGSAWAAESVGTNGYALIAKSGGTNGLVWAALIPAGTVSLFYQAAAPTGWTVSDADSDKALRVVSGASGLGGAAGGTTAFTTVFAARTIAQANLPNVNLTAAADGDHNHGGTRNSTGANVAEDSTCPLAYGVGSGGTGTWTFDPGFSQITHGGSDHSATGNSTSNDVFGPVYIPASGTHTHSVPLGGSGTALDFAVQYCSVIKASKDAF